MTHAPIAASTQASQDDAHPHVGAGSPQGGQFATKGSGSGSSSKPTGAERGTWRNAPDAPARKSGGSKPFAGPAAPAIKNNLTRKGPNDPAEVKALQQMLNSLKLGPVGEDGSFGADTETAVKALQAKLGVHPTGHASPALGKRLQDAVALSPCVHASAGSTFIAAAADSSKPYGDVGYADPGYQSDGKERYPLNSEAHCRAAWSYINQADNAAQYSPGDLAKVKAAILAAGHKYGINFVQDKVAASAAPMTGVELARPGSWQLSTGKRSFTAGDLRDAADFFQATGQTRIPVGFGHADRRFDGNPAFGWVSNIRYAEDGKGPVLLGDLVDMDEWLAAAAPTRWPNRSIEGFANLDYNGRTYSLALNRLALLGDTAPAIPGLRSLADIREAIAAAAESSGAEFISASAPPSEMDTTDPAPEAVVPTSPKETGMDPAKFREALGLDDASDEEVMDALAEAGFVPQSDTPTPVAASAPSPGSTILVEASAWNDREDRIKRLEAAEQRHRDGERDQIIAAAVQDGKFAPARREHWVRAWNADPEGTRGIIATLARNLIPIAASGYSGESDEELDQEFKHLFPPTVSKGA